MRQDVRLARYDVRTGWLPPVCPRHGTPTTDRRKQKFSSKTPPWLHALALVLFLTLSLIGLLIVAIVGNSVTKTERAAMPTCEQCRADRTPVRLLRVISGLAGFALLVGAAVASSVVLVLTGSLVLLIWVASLTSTAEGLYAIRGRVVDDHWLDLRDVHPNFVAAIRPNPAWMFVPAAYGYVHQPAHWQ